MSNAARWIWKVTGNTKRLILLLIIAQILSGGLGAVYALQLRNVVDSASSGNIAAFRGYTIGLIVLTAMQLAVAAAIRWLHELSRSDVENVLKRRLTDEILRKDYAAVSSIHSAEWLNRLTNDTAVVADGTAEILPGLAGMAVRLLAAVAMMLWLDSWFARLLIPGGILLLALAYAVRRVLKRLHKGIQESDGRLRIFLQERIGSLAVIRSFAAEDQISDEAAGKMAEHKAARMKRLRFSNAANLGYGAAVRGMVLIGIIYCSNGILTGRVSVGTLTAVMHLMNQVRGPFANISGYLPRWYAMLASAERLMEIESFADDGTPMDGETIRKFYKTEFRSLGLRGASFAYPGGENGLHNADLEIRKGEYVALVGPSGCGKTTALKLLMCLYPLDKGERFINDEPLTAEYRRLFAYVPQGNALMNGTVRQAISLADPSAADDDARIEHALSVACADEFVTEPDAELGERGSGLSEGQIQRLAIARAVFSEAPILILDEATSALDIGTEERLLHNLRSMTDKTVIIVTHRKAALDICDRVLRFDSDGVEPA